MADRKATDRRITRLHASLEAGDLEGVAEELSAGVSSFLLTRFRERKLILRAPVGVRKAVNSDWRIVGRGVKLKRDRHVLTDLDLLLLREDPLRVVQIKAMIGSGATVYDHWKNRQTIELGCSQGRIAAKFLESDANALVSLCGKRAAARLANHVSVEPVAFTSSFRRGSVR